MSNYHFYFGGGFQVATGSSQTTDQRSRNYGHREIADSPQLRHVSPHSSNRNRSAVELLSRQEAKSRRSKHPRSRSRSKRIRKASSKSRSLSSEDRVQPAMHAPFRKLPPRPSSPPPGCVGLHPHHQHTSAQSSNQRHDGAPNAGVGWLTPPGPHACATATTTTLPSNVAMPVAGCNTLAASVPIHVAKQRKDPYVYTQATTKSAPSCGGRYTKFLLKHMLRKHYCFTMTI